MRSWLPLAVAGMLGVLTRHTIQRSVPQHGGFPWGTLIVNVSGALAIGFVAALVAHKLSTPLWVQEALTVGFLGGYTTFSALALDTVVLMDRGRYAVAAGYSFGTLAAGVLAVMLGLRLGRVL
jgi:CrcB protein